MISAGTALDPLERCDLSLVNGGPFFRRRVDRLRPFPVGLCSLLLLALAALLPFLPVVAIEVPLQELLRQIASALLCSGRTR